MTHLLRPYDEVSDAAQSWLGMLPSHWRCLPNRVLFEEIKNQGHDDEELLSVTIGRGVIRQSDLLATTSKKDSSNLDKSKYQLVEPGDIAYNKMRAWQGSVGVSAYRGIVSPAYIVERLRRDNIPRYFHHLLRTPAFASEAERWSYGITSDQWSLRPEHFKMIYSCVPPVGEQGLIVRFVDHFDRQINRLIRNKRQLIGLLEQRKQAVASQALRNGLGMNSRRSDSGADWLGEIPRHWQFVRFKSRVGFQEGPGIMAEDFRDEGVPLLRISSLAGENATLDGCNFLDPSMVAKRWSHFGIRSGDYLLTASGSLGKVTRAGDLVAGSVPYTGIIRLWPLTPDVDMEFVQIFLGSDLFALQIARAKAGVGIEHFGPTHLKRMMMVLPPLDEQRAIAKRVIGENTSSDKAVRRAQREVELLREYRTRLVADVVTGKEDVRAVAARLTDEEEPELLDEAAETPEGELEEAEGTADVSEEALV